MYLGGFLCEDPEEGSRTLGLDHLDDFVAHEPQADSLKEATIRFGVVATEEHRTPSHWPVQSGVSAVPKLATKSPPGSSQAAIRPNSSACLSRGTCEIE